MANSNSIYENLADSAVYETVRNQGEDNIAYTTINLAERNSKKLKCKFSKAVLLAVGIVVLLVLCIVLSSLSLAKIELHLKDNSQKETGFLFTPNTTPQIRTTTATTEGPTTEGPTTEGPTTERTTTERTTTERTTTVATTTCTDTTTTPTITHATSSTTTLSTERCPTNYKLNPHSNTCFGTGGASTNWTAAKEFCENKGEFLATLHSCESALWLQQEKQNGAWRVGSYWIGGKCVSGQWRWYGRITGPIMYTLLRIGEPNNVNGTEDCIELDDSFWWNDNNCDVRRYSICETSVM